LLEATNAREGIKTNNFLTVQKFMGLHLAKPKFRGVQSGRKDFGQMEGKVRITAATLPNKRLQPTCSACI